MRPRPHLDPRALALVALGGALGTALRVAVSLVVPRVGAVDLPTVLVDVVGAFLLGLLLGRLARSGPDEGRRRDLRLGLGTGVLGGFTTWSALATGTVTTAGSGHLAIAVAEGLGSVLLGVLAAGVGLVVAGRGSGGPGRPVAPVPPADAPPGPAVGPRP